MAAQIILQSYIDAHQGDVNREESG
jgi:hypothetical protein